MKPAIKPPPPKPTPQVIVERRRATTKETTDLVDSLAAIVERVMHR